MGEQKYNPPVEEIPDLGASGDGRQGGGATGTPSGNTPPSSAISVGSDGGLVAEVDGLYTGPDHLDGHRHAILPQNFNTETGNGVTEVEGIIGSGVPPHTHAVIGFFVQTYQRGSYISIHG